MITIIENLAVAQSWHHLKSRSWCHLFTGVGLSEGFIRGWIQTGAGVVSSLTSRDKTEKQISKWKIISSAAVFNISIKDNHVHLIW